MSKNNVCVEKKRPPSDSILDNLYLPSMPLVNIYTKLSRGKATHDIVNLHAPHLRQIEILEVWSAQDHPTPERSRHRVLL